MSSNLYTKYGMDFSSVFKTGTGKQFLNIYGDDGMDIGQKYVAGTSPFPTGFCVSSGQDVNRLLYTDGQTWGTVRRTSGGWDAAEDGGNYDSSYLARRAQILRDSWNNTSQFVVVGSTDSMCDETGYYRHASKFFRIDQRAGAPTLTGIRIQIIVHGTNNKAGVAPFYIEHPRADVFTFVLGYFRRKHGYVYGQMLIYAQSALGEALMYTFNFSQP